MVLNINLTDIFQLRVIISINDEFLVRVLYQKLNYYQQNNEKNKIIKLIRLLIFKLNECFHIKRPSEFLGN